jgi:hypothetical protein
MSATVRSAVKCYASDVAIEVTTDAVQLFGGAGYTKDFPVERMMRDAKITQIYEGTNQIQRVVMVRLDVAALAEHYGVDAASHVLVGIDDYYSDQHGQGSGVADQVVRQLADPRPKDSSVTRQLGEYRNLASRWTDWKQVVGVCRDVAEGMLGIEG